MNLVERMLARLTPQQKVAARHQLRTAAGVLPRHLLGQSAVQEPLQMCPEPWNPDGMHSPFCPRCLGTGAVTVEELSRWQREMNDLAES